MVIATYCVARQLPLPDPGIIYSRKEKGVANYTVLSVHFSVPVVDDFAEEEGGGRQALPNGASRTSPRLWQALAGGL